MARLSSRERMLSVLRYEEPDRVPLLLNTFGFQPPPPLGWSSQYEEARTWLSLGVDDWLDIWPPHVFHPDVKVRQWEESRPGDPWPCMVKEYDTPAGVFRQEVYRTDDWVSPEWPTHRDEAPGINLLDDYNVPRYRACPIESEQDLEKLRYLIRPVPDEAISGFQERADVVARQARELGVLLVGGASDGADAASWLCGHEPLLFMAMDRPGLFEEMLDIIHVREKRNVELLLDTPVDLIMRRGYYEGTTFWSPGLYRRYFLPRIRELADLVHQGDRMMGYTMSVGWLPLLDAFVESGIDAQNLLDPIAGGQRIDLARVKSAFNKRVAVIGGLNEPITLHRGSARDIREELFRAVRDLGEGGGLALSVAEAIMPTTPWRSIETLIEAWKEVRD